MADTIIETKALTKRYGALTAVDGRAGGTCELSPCETLEATLALAREKGAARVLVLEQQGERLVDVP